MANNEIIDNEIVKALRCCFIEVDCSNCPCYIDNPLNGLCLEATVENAIDLINRQKTEIERLTKENYDLRESECDHCACMLLERIDGLQKKINELSARNFADKEIKKIIDAV